VTATKTAINDALQGVLDFYFNSGLWDVMHGAGMHAINAMAQGVIANIPAMLTSARTAIQSFFQGLQQQSPAIIAKGGEVVTKLVGGIIDNLPDIVGAAVDIVTGLARTILANMPAIAKTGVELIKAIIGGLFQALPDLLQGAIDIIVDVAEVLLHEIPISIYNVGAEIVKGIYQGILDSWDWLKNNLKTWAGNIVGTVKDALGVNSPSKVFRDQVGTAIPEGVAVGMNKAAPKVYSTADEINRKALYRMQMIEAKYKQTGSDAVSDMAEGMQAAEPTALAVAQELNNRLLEKQDELKEALKAKKLDEATKESLNKQLDAVKTFQSEYQAALDDIVKSQESMATRLQAYGELFTRVTDEESGKELINVEDLQEQISKLDEFNQVLINLENRQIPEGLLDNIAQMDVDDAIAYGTELLKMSSSQFDSYITLWTQKQQKAQQIAERYYQGELTALKSEYLDKIPAELSNLKGQIDGMGKEVGKAITESIGQGAGNAAIAIGQMQSEDTTEADVFTKTVEGLRSQQQILIDYLIQLMKLSLSTIRDFLGDFQDAGRQLMNGLGQGILDGRSAVIEAIRSTLESIVEQAKRSLQINSPSKVFAEIGDYTAQGFGVGFTDRMDTVTKDVAAAMPYSIGDNRLANNSTSNDNRIYNGGDLILNIERVDNGNGRSIEDLARELEFYRRQQTTAIGGAW
jgi:phage-related protein